MSCRHYKKPLTVTLSSKYSTLSKQACRVTETLTYCLLWSKSSYDVSGCATLQDSYNAKSSQKVQRLTTHTYTSETTAHQPELTRIVLELSTWAFWETHQRILFQWQSQGLQMATKSQVCPLSQWDPAECQAQVTDATRLLQCSMHFCSITVAGEYRSADSLRTLSGASPPACSAFDRKNLQ